MQLQHDKIYYMLIISVYNLNFTRQGQFFDKRSQTIIVMLVAITWFLWHLRYFYRSKSKSLFMRTRENCYVTIVVVIHVAIHEIRMFEISLPLVHLFTHH